MWYYLEDRVTRGPAPHEEMLTLFREQRLPTSTLVWREGMSDWLPASQVGLLPPVAPPEAEQLLQAAEPQSLPSDRAAAGALAWRRFLARQIDFLLFALFAGVLVAAVSPELAKWVTEVQDFYTGMVLIAAFIPVEALMLSRSGATPGKRLFALRVVHRDGQLMRWSTALVRSWRVYLLGQAAGLPIVSLIARGLAYQRFIEHGRTFWDDSCDTEVRATEMTQGRKLAAASLFGLYLALLYLGVASALS